MNTALDAPEARTYVSQGLRLHYTDWGNESAPPLILVHGGLDQSRNWDAMARALRPRFHIVAPDLRGHGRDKFSGQEGQADRRPGSPSGSVTSTKRRNGKSTAIRRWPMALIASWRVMHG